MFLTPSVIRHILLWLQHTGAQAQNWIGPMKRLYEALRTLPERLLAPVRPRRAYVPDIPMLAECHSCQRFIRGAMANRLTVHLIDVHDMEDSHAYETVDWVFARVRDHLAERKTNASHQTDL